MPKTINLCKPITAYRYDELSEGAKRIALFCMANELHLPLAYIFMPEDQWEEFPMEIVKNNPMYFEDGSIIPIKKNSLRIGSQYIEIVEEG